MKLRGRILSVVEAEPPCFNSRAAPPVPSVPETFKWILPEFLPEILPELEIYNWKVNGTVGIRHILTQHEPVKGGLSPVRVVLIYVVYPLCRKLFSCIFLIPVKIPVKSNSGKIHSKVSGTGYMSYALNLHILRLRTSNASPKHSQCISNRKTFRRKSL